jgi:predicted nucleic acid-binding protein
MTRPVVADSSPLIGLATGGVFPLLEQLYGRLTITRVVKDEVTGRDDRPGARELDAAMRAGWIRVAPAPPATWELTCLDAGEASTIALAMTRPGALVLMDDLLGRSRAEELTLDVLDTGGLLLAARSAGLLADVALLVKRLARRGFTLPDAARRALDGTADGASVL